MRTACEGRLLTYIAEEYILRIWKEQEKMRERVRVSAERLKKNLDAITDEEGCIKPQYLVAYNRADKEHRALEKEAMRLDKKVSWLLDYYEVWFVSGECQRKQIPEDLIAMAQRSVDNNQPKILRTIAEKHDLPLLVNTLVEIRKQFVSDHWYEYQKLVSAGRVTFVNLFVTEEPGGWTWIDEVKKGEGAPDYDKKLQAG